jgi:hypothetical protein
MTPLEAERRLETVLLPVAEQLHLSSEQTGMLRRTLASALSRGEMAGERPYEEILRSVQRAWQEWRAHEAAPTERLYFMAFANEAMALAGATEGQTRGRRFLTSLFAMAVRSSYLRGHPLTRAQQEVLSTLLQWLAEGRIGDEEIIQADLSLTRVGLESGWTLDEGTTEFAALWEGE